MGFSLQANAKVIEGRQHEDRDAQFGYLNRRVGEHIAAGQPVISVDTKKKELVGEFKNGGREYQPKGQPVPTNVHDFMDKELGKAIPYGVYDVADQHRLGVGGHRPRHLRVRRGDPAPLVGHHRAAPLPARRPAADLRRRRRLQRLPGPRLEDRTGRASPPRPGWPSPSATCHRAPANGTRSNTGCSPRSP